jgi:3-oxoacyl-[acyl-carrier-protein] synthase II
VVLAIERALASAGVSAADVDHVNAHATSTPIGDEGEARAIRRVFGERANDILVTAPKSMIGHTLGAAGGIETAILAMTIQRSLIPPTINAEERDPACDLNVVTGSAREQRVSVAIKNSFGFGGTNASLLLKRYDGSYGV